MAIRFYSKSPKRQKASTLLARQVFYGLALTVTVRDDDTDPLLFTRRLLGFHPLLVAACFWLAAACTRVADTPARLHSRIERRAALIRADLRAWRQLLYPCYLPG